jgi:hypothetical protein
LQKFTNARSNFQEISKGTLCEGVHGLVVGCMPSHRSHPPVVGCVNKRMVEIQNENEFSDGMQSCLQHKGACITLIGALHIT